jgi:hypothetical protein
MNSEPRLIANADSCAKTRMFRMLFPGLALVFLCFAAVLRHVVVVGGGATGHRTPAGQFRADLRSLVAVTRYLMETDGNAPGQASPPVQPPPGFVLRAVDIPSPSLVESPGRMPEPLTNRPARG